MKALLINGSPKGNRSNTYQLSNAFLEGLNADEVRQCCVRDLEIKPCLGCFSCWNKTPGTCCLSDDMASVIEDLLWADVIVWSFPLYYFNIPGPLKNLIDRQLPMVLPFMNADSESGSHPTRYDMSGKQHVVISTCGFYTAEGNYDGVNAMFDHMCGKGKYTTIYCGQGELFRVKELRGRTEEYLAVVTEAGREFAEGKIQPGTREKLSRLLFPRQTFEAMADASWGVEPSGAQTEESLTFTRQMGALYNKAAFTGQDKVLEMVYTDLGKRYQLILGKDGCTVIDDNFRTATTTIETSYELWKAIASGEVKGDEALFQKKYRVKGDVGLMINWEKYFGAEEEPAAVAVPQSAQKKTSMLLLLLPWMAFWIGTPMMELSVAALVSIGISVLLPVIFMKFKLLVFDSISIAAVAICSILLLLGVDYSYVLPLSYFMFGLLWTVCGFRKIPLTAHYSVNSYTGNMMDNPIFIKTNRILTLCWGVLYLLMTAWTAVLVNMGFDWIATVNSLLPMAMGIFTAWFQKWYPARVIRGE